MARHWRLDKTARKCAELKRKGRPYKVSVRTILSFFSSFFLSGSKTKILVRPTKSRPYGVMSASSWSCRTPPPLNTHCPDPDHVMGSTLSCDGITCWGARLAFTLTKRTCLFPAQCVWCGVDATFDARAAEIHLTGATLCKNHDFNFQTLRKSMVKLMAVNFYHPDAWGYKEKKREFS